MYQLASRLYELKSENMGDYLANCNWCTDEQYKKEIIKSNQYVVLFLFAEI